MEGKVHALLGSVSSAEEVGPAKDSGTDSTQHILNIRNWQTLEETSLE